MGDNRRFYQILECAPNAQPDEIKKKYRRLSAKWHPDKNPDNVEEATRRFQEISGAYAVLSDPEKRRIYDRFGEEGLKQAERTGSAGGTPMHPFAQMFGFGGMGGMGGMGRQGPRKAQPITHQVRCSMRELYTGARKKLRVPYKASCEPCEGTGNASKRLATCTGCNGRGQRIEHRQIGPGMLQQIARPCHQCQGSGETSDPKDRCMTCHGRKWVQAVRDIDFTVYPGMEWGMKMLLEAKGDELRDQITGDVIIVISPDGSDAALAAQEPKYQLKNGDLVYELSISLLSALIGLRYRLRHPGSGRWLSINNPEVIQPGQVYMLPGQGMPRVNRQAVQQQVPLEAMTTQYGDMIVRFKIRFPEKISKTQKTVLRKLFSGTGDTPDAEANGGEEGTRPHVESNSLKSGEVPPMDISNSTIEERPDDLQVTLQPLDQSRASAYQDAQGGQEDEEEFGEDGMPEGVQCAQQ